MLNVSGRRVVIERALGQGGFGTVSLVSDASTAELFALKDIACQNPTAITSALEEINTLRSLCHPRITKLIAADQISDMYGIPHVRILMEYCSGGNLNDRLVRPGYDPLKNLKWMRQIADALAYLHWCKTVHRDLKPENVLLTDKVNEDIKLADFGLARKYIALRQNNTELHDAQYYMQTGVGTLHYIAPEVFDVCAHYTEKCDVFSLGVLFYAIAERRFVQLSGGKRMYGAFVSIPIHGEVGLGYAMANGYPNMMVTFTEASTNVQQLIKNVLSYDYHQRMSASDVKRNCETVERKMIFARAISHSSMIANSTMM